MPELNGEPTRNEWCRNRPQDKLSEVFYPGEMMRCTLSRVFASGQRRTCGGDLGRAPDTVREAVVRGPLGLPPIRDSQHEHRTCGSCRKTLDVFLVGRVLEATG